MLALIGGALLAGFDAGAIGFVLPAMRAATGASAQAASWLLSVFVAATLVAVPLCAVAVRRWGAPRLLRACIAFAALAAASATLAPGTGTVLAARALQGLAHGPLLPLAAAVVVMHWPPQRQGRLIGLISLGYGLAFLAAMVGTPWLLQFGWRSGFAMSCALALATLALPLPAHTGAATVDLATPNGMWRSLLCRPMLAIAVLAFGTGVGQAVLVWFPTLAVARLGVAMTDTSLLMLPLVAGGLAATLLVIALLDRLGARPLVFGGALLTLAGVLLAAAAPASHVAFMAGAAVLGLGITGLCGGPLRYAAARARPMAEQGLAQGSVALLTNLGVLGGSILLGVLAGRGGDTRAAIEGALLLACALMAVAFLAALALPARAAAGHAVAAAPDAGTGSGAPGGA